MSFRNKKGAAPLFVKKQQKLKFISPDDESDDEVQQKIPSAVNKIHGDQNPPPQRDLDETVIDLTSEGTPIKSPAVPSFIDLLKHSNFKEIVTDYVQKHFPEKKDNVIDEPTLRYFHDLYLNQPTSRRCPEINLSRLVIKPPKPSPKEEELLQKYNIKPCRVSMNKQNVVYSIEKRIYERFRQNNPITREHTPLIKPEVLHCMAMEYISLLNLNPVWEYVPRDQMLIIDMLVEELFKQLDLRTPPAEPNEYLADALKDLSLEESNVSGECSGAVGVSQKLDILDFTYNDKYQCTAKRIEDKFLKDGKLEIPVTLYTEEGPLDVTLRGDDIGRFLLMTPRQCKLLKDITANLSKLMQDTPINPINTNLLQKFSEFLSGALKGAKENPRNEEIIRQYIQHGIENDEFEDELLNYIEVIEN